MAGTKPRRSGRYPAELRERAVRMVFEAEAHAASQWAAITSIASKFGMTPHRGGHEPTLTLDGSKGWSTGQTRPR